MFLLMLCVIVKVGMMDYSFHPNVVKSGPHPRVVLLYKGSLMSSPSDLALCRISLVAVTLIMTCHAASFTEILNGLFYNVPLLNWSSLPIVMWCPKVIRNRLKLNRK